jgi:outer membrane protein TolC
MGNYFYRGDFAHSENNLYTWNVFLKLDIPLYDFGGVRAAIARQESLIRAEREVLKALKNNVVLQIDQSYQKAESLKAKLIGLQKSIEKDRETLDLYKEKYGKDLVTLQDVLQQQDLLDQDLQTYLETEIDLAMTQLSLKKAMGSDILMCYTN